MDDTKPKTWRATLTPHRSLSPQGFVILMSVIAGFNFIVGLFFYVIGAWPVVGFMGLDVALIWWAFRANFADARRAEHIEITADELVLRRLAERPALLRSSALPGAGCGLNWKRTGSGNWWGRSICGSAENARKSPVFSGPRSGFPLQTP